MTEVRLETPLRDWAEGLAGGSVVAASRHFEGASRDAWNLDVESGGSVRPLFLLRDKNDGGGSARDAAVLEALGPTRVPVPAVLGRNDSLGTILLERVPGRSDFPAIDYEPEREQTALHLMELTATLHALDPASLEIRHLEIPISSADCSQGARDQIRSALASLGPRADPFFAFSLAWLEANLPADIARFSLVHSDMGPGNFLFEGGRVTGIVDWEVAHFGDPMEDLAAIAVRDMATPIGHLPTRLAEYQVSAGIEIDLERIGYYRALVLTRNSLMIGLGLAHPSASFDFVEMSMYQTLLMRAAALVICDNLQLDRPGPPAIGTTATTRGGAGAARDERFDLLVALQRDLLETVAPAVRDVEAERRCAGLARGLATLEHEGRVGPFLDLAERNEIGDLLGRRFDDRASAEAALAERFEEESPPAHVEKAALYFARRMMRLAERRRPLLGPLYHRLPQPLEDR